MRSSRTRAEMLEETGELAAAVTAILTGAGSAVDPRALISLRAAIRELDPAGGAPGYQAGRRADRHTGTPAASTGPTVSCWRRSVTPKTRSATGSTTLTSSTNRSPPRPPQPTPAGNAPNWTCRPPSRTWPPRSSCPPTTTATAAAARPPRSPPPRQPAPPPRNRSPTPPGAPVSARPPPASLGALAGRLTRALARLRTVPQDLGEVYQLIYECIRGGGRLPTCARWIEGEGAARLPAREPAVPDVRQSRVQMLCVFSIPDRRVQLGDRHRARTLDRPTNPYPTNIPQPKLQAQNRTPGSRGGLRIIRSRPSLSDPREGKAFVQAGEHPFGPVQPSPVFAAASLCGLTSSRTWALPEMVNGPGCRLRFQSWLQPCPL